MEKTTRNISKNHALPVGIQGEMRFMVRRKTLFGSSGDRDEDNTACHYGTDGPAGRYDSRLRHPKQAAKLVRGMYHSL